LTIADRAPLWVSDVARDDLHLIDAGLETDAQAGVALEAVGRGLVAA
jgi:hypothetical protein